MDNAPAGADTPEAAAAAARICPSKALIMSMIKKGVHFMAINLKGRSFLTLEDFTPAEIRYLLTWATT